MNWLCGKCRTWLSGLHGNARSAVACAMLLSFLLAHFGYPVWEPAVSKGDAPFACQFKRCCCQSADQCRQSCCCSKGGKLALRITPKVETKASCCSKKPVAPANERTEVRWVLAISASECQGTAVDWIQTGFVATPPRTVDLNIAIPEAAAVGELGGSYSAPFSERLLRPV